MILTTNPRSSFYQQNSFIPNQHHFSDLPLNGQSLEGKIDTLNQFGNGLDFNFELDLVDLDDLCGTSSSASSPTSTQSLLSQFQGTQASSLATLDTIPTIAVPRGMNHRSLLRASGDQRRPSNLANIAPGYSSNVDMQVESWLQTGQLTPKSAGRAYSLSPGSAGPASPYSQNTSNPQIAMADGVPDGLPHLAGPEDYNHYMAKSFPASQDSTFYANYPNYTYHAPSSAAKPRLANGTVKSRPLSVASSIASDSSPATPAGEPDDDGRRQKIVFNAVPKLDRTMTDVYNDELYSPNFTVGASASSQMAPVSPNNDLFVQRLQAANSQHLNAGQSPISITSRGRSPFQNGSPLAPTPIHDFCGGLVPAQIPFTKEKRGRDQGRAAQDAQVLQSQFAKGTNTSTPQTISPKDAVLDYQNDGEANFPLFPTTETATFDATELSKAVAQAQQAFGSAALDGTFGDFATPQLHTAFPIPQQYPFVADSSHQSSMTPVSNPSTGPSRLGSSDFHSDSTHSSSPMRPSTTSADGGTYTCTYHGCTFRFETPALLQKHKREGHRQAHGLGGTARRVDSPNSGMTSSFLNTQAGPHRCDRINPSTGKPCNTIFSRPYDLTRHEDTIHNARKQKVRCEFCTEVKEFSRADALSRHLRVVHPEIDFPGKQRRRGGHDT